MGVFGTLFLLLKVRDRYVVAKSVVRGLNWSKGGSVGLVEYMSRLTFGSIWQLVFLYYSWLTCAVIQEDLTRLWNHQLLCEGSPTLG